MTTKQALDAAMQSAAGYTNAVRRLESLASEVPEAQFQRLAGQHPDTLNRELANAEQDFQKAKAAYEAHCLEIGEPAYATYNED